MHDICSLNIITIKFIESSKESFQPISRCQLRYMKLLKLYKIQTLVDRPIGKSDFLDRPTFGKYFNCFEVFENYIVKFSSFIVCLL